MSEYECYAPSNKSGSMYFDKQAINGKAVAFMYSLLVEKYSNSSRQQQHDETCVSVEHLRSIIIFGQNNYLYPWNE